MRGYIFIRRFFGVIIAGFKLGARVIGPRFPSFEPFGNSLLWITVLRSRKSNGKMIYVI